MKMKIKNNLIVAIALVAMVAIVGGVVVLAMTNDPHKENIANYLSVLVSVIVLPVATALLGLLKDQHDTTKETNVIVSKLANGEMDKKIEKVVRGLLEEFNGGPPPESPDQADSTK